MQIDEKLSDFIKKFTANLKNISADEFNRYKALLLDSTGKYFAEKVEDEFYKTYLLVNQIKKNNFDVNAYKPYESILDDIQHDEFLKFIDDYIIINYRKLNLHVIGTADDSKKGMDYKRHNY